MAAGLKKGTLCLTVDNLGDALAVGRGRAARPDAQDNSLQVGVPAFLDLFAELSLQATFFVEGWNALHHHEVIERIAAAGHEIGLHGWLHEYWAKDLDDRTREQLLWDGTAALRLAGFNPAAFRAPGGYRGSHTLEVLGDLGYRIDSSIDVDRGAEGTMLQLEILQGEILSIPWTFDMIDYWHYGSCPEGPRDPDTVAKHWTGLIDVAADRCGLVTLIVHPFVSGVDAARMAALRCALVHAVEHPGIEVRSAGQVADAYFGQGKPAPPQYISDSTPR